MRYKITSMESRDKERVYDVSFSDGAVVFIHLDRHYWSYIENNDEETFFDGYFVEEDDVDELIYSPEHPLPMHVVQALEAIGYDASDVRNKQGAKTIDEICDSRQDLLDAASRIVMAYGGPAAADEALQEEMAIAAKNFLQTLRIV